MPSPFPGMNPYFEQPDAWSEFHDHILFAIADLVEPQLGEGYFVKVDQNIYGEESDGSAMELIGRGAAFVSKSHDAISTAPARPGAAEALRGPAKIFVPGEMTEEEAFLEIRDRKTRQVLAVLELLSPTNKQPGPKREQFLAKRWRVLASSAHYIEIDLRRGYPRLPWRGLPVCDYYVALSREEERPEAELWPLRLRDPLPTVPVPLRAGDVTVTLDLQAALHRVYDLGGYRKYIYDSDPEPPLSAEDAAWAKAILHHG